MRIEVRQGDITELDVDVIVNAANASLLGGGGVDGAIHRAAGPRLLEACKAVPQIGPGMRCPTGEVRITDGFNLKARHIFHTVGPVWRDGKHNEPEQLANCYWQSLKLAEQMMLHSIAFPAISCGIYGYPLYQAARIAVTETRHWQRSHKVPKHIVLVAYNEATYKTYQQALAAQQTATANCQLPDAGDHRVLR
ncbi:O-acetyl-ADP-ribose deacetylase [Xanthomonas fragariae]|uniref:O-acetyl-ADP-ribose deacetylase n=1 Tax=Xanthomonas fragariae TaxID=48664 RepID=UPI000D556856|nr:O-acetyl-ADP-ribose deacetylase [Xanthomonas fragariae]MDM7554206.1 O-acetyl-ADP-ribose deacetylase [Xanthomonas fragariae]MDM7557339.1 O-acetyl-ADP-ribose deacetylase [Xanthomonas fragariae]MDM7575018.1 O-acetyl-ADP-ribose deacetylase [Xanthomonas fragariae]MDM7578154.1 O-acetyl-ADP-ribose deacetylase [Xanthomonas fragariae]MDM7588355.1 O-acetyl-ADP-ribose deacetylase [Xanthomonas fragariae]